MSELTGAERLAALIDDAALRLDAVSGGVAVCTFTKAGASVPGIKYAEGRWAALREVSRAIRRDGAPLDEAARAAHDQWTRALDALRQRESSADWIAYRTGGTDALDDLLGTDRAPG